MKTLLVFAAAVLVLVPAAFGTSVVAPSSCSGVLCGDDSSRPFHNSNDNYAKQQQIFTPTDLGTTAMTITAIAFRPNSRFDSDSWSIQTIVNMGYTSLATFPNDNFITTGLTQVFGLGGAAATFSGSCSTTANDTSAAQNFCAVMNLTTPFVWDPVANPGKNLVVDLIRSNDTSGLMNFHLDAANLGSSNYRTNRESSDDSSFEGSRRTDEFIVMQFSGTQVGIEPAANTPEPASLAMMGGGLLALGLFHRRRRRA